jgi:hypothetical protein
MTLRTAQLVPLPSPPLGWAKGSVNSVVARVPRNAYRALCAMNWRQMDTCAELHAQLAS